MPTAPQPPVSSIALRVAAAMQQQGIESLPRNYELVYEAYAGNNPDLTREFVALGPVKTQAMLDRLGSKYLPHQHEQGLFSHHNRKMRGEMGHLVKLINEEKLTLGDFGRVLEAVAEIMGGSVAMNPRAVSASLTQLQAATDRIASTNGTIANAIHDKAEALADLQRQFEAEEIARYRDAATGLGNRRLFNTALSKVYVRQNNPVVCGVAIGEIQGLDQMLGVMPSARKERVVKAAAGVVAANVGGRDLPCRFDGGRFGLLLYSADEEQVLRQVEAVRAGIAAKLVAGDAQGPVRLPVSFGMCMSQQAHNAFDLVSAGEKALAASRAQGSRTTAIFSRSRPANAPKDWLIYRG